MLVIGRSQPLTSQPTGTSGIIMRRCLGPMRLLPGSIKPLAGSIKPLAGSIRPFEGAGRGFASHIIRT